MAENRGAAELVNTVLHPTGALHAACKSASAGSHAFALSQQLPEAPKRTPPPPPRGRRGAERPVDHHVRPHTRAPQQRQRLAPAARGLGRRQRRRQAPLVAPQAPQQAARLAGLRGARQAGEAGARGDLVGGREALEQLEAERPSLGQAAQRLGAKALRAYSMVIMVQIEAIPMLQAVKEM